MGAGEIEDLLAGKTLGERKRQEAAARLAKLRRDQVSWDRERETASSREDKRIKRRSMTTAQKALIAATVSAVAAAIGIILRLLEAR